MFLSILCCSLFLTHPHASLSPPPFLLDLFNVFFFLGWSNLLLSSWILCLFLHSYMPSLSSSVPICLALFFVIDFPCLSLCLHHCPPPVYSLSRLSFSISRLSFLLFLSISLTPFLSLVLALVVSIRVSLFLSPRLFCCSLSFFLSFFLSLFLSDRRQRRRP